MKDDIDNLIDFLLSQKQAGKIDSLAVSCVLKDDNKVAGVSNRWVNGSLLLIGAVGQLEYSMKRGFDQSTTPVVMPESTATILN